MPTSPTTAATVPTDETVLDRRFVRVLGRGPGDLVRFEFAIGWPDLAAELMLPKAQFDAFCVREHVQMLPEGQTGAGPATGTPEGDDA